MEEEATAAVEIEHHELTSFSGVEPRFNFQPNHGSFLSTMSMTSCEISYTANAKRILIAFILFTSVPLVIGAAFTSIFIEDKNYNAAFVSFFIACISLGTLSLFILHLVSKLEKFHDLGTLEGVKVLGMIMSVASGISVGVYTILSFFKRQTFKLNGANYFSSAIFSGLCLAVSIQLFMTAQWYQNALKESERKKRLEDLRTLNSTSRAIN